MQPRRCLGIDLGTTNSCAAAMRAAPVVLPNPEGARTTPSVVAYPGPGLPLVGERARRRQEADPENTFWATKRLIGRRFGDWETREAAAHAPYRIVPGPGGEAALFVPALGVTKSPVEIGSQVLRYLVGRQAEGRAGDWGGGRAGERAGGRAGDQGVGPAGAPGPGASSPAPPEAGPLGLGPPAPGGPPPAGLQAVITCPAYFNDSQRRATELAGRMAGLDVARIIAEPTAAALLYNFEVSSGSGDRGARPLEPGEVFAVVDLGGGTYDISVLECTGEGVFSVISTAGDGYLGGEDWDKAVAEYLLSHFISQYEKDLGPAEIEKLRSDPRVTASVRSAAEQAKMALSTSEEVQVRVPDLYKGRPLSLSVSRADFERITAPVLQRIVRPVRLALADANLEAQDISKVLLVGGMTRVPSVRQQVRKLFGKEGLGVLNPDESVAMGAAIQGAILNKGVTNLLLLDVTPLSLGIETFGGGFSPIIKRNTTIPTKKRQVFTTAEDGQTLVKIKVYQGERPIAAQNNLLGEFELQDIPPLPKGRVNIEVTFEIDENGLVTVKAADQETHREHQIRISNTVLPEAEVQRILKEAEANKERDAVLQELGGINYAVPRVAASAKEVLARFSGPEAKEAKGLRGAAHKKLQEALREIEQTVAEAGVWEAQEPQFSATSSATVQSLGERKEAGTKLLDRLQNLILRVGEIAYDRK